MKKLKVMTVVGTRPEIIRLSAVINKLDKSEAIDHILVHTGQNYDYELTEHKDNRGAFVEIIKTFDSGQFSISTSKPGITRGNHYHNTKNEKFLVIKGEAVIRFRPIYSDEVIEYPVSDKKLEIVDIPVGYTHNITNTGDSEMILVIWANELFDKENPDTYFLEV